MKGKTKSPSQIVDALIYAEFFHEAPDAQRIIRTERMKLQSAIASGDAESIIKQGEEAVRVARMWRADL